MEKTNPNGKACPLRCILGDFLGLCRANVGPFWVYVGSLLGHLEGNVGLHGGLRNEKFKPNRKLLSCDHGAILYLTETSWNSIPQISGKNTVFRDFPTFSRICIFFLL